VKRFTGRGWKIEDGGWCLIPRSRRLPVDWRTVGTRGSRGRSPHHSAFRIPHSALRTPHSIRPLDAARSRHTFSGMGNGKKKPFNPREVAKPEKPRRGAIVLALIVGVVIGSAGTYVFNKTPDAAPKPSVAATPTPAPSFGITPPAQTLGTPTATATPQQQFTPAPQPPGPAPAGQVWSVEHGHWHPAPAPAATPTPAPTLITTPVTTPAEKKE
jgi:hypothetical protein